MFVVCLLHDVLVDEFLVLPCVHSDSGQLITEHEPLCGYSQPNIHSIGVTFADDARKHMMTSSLFAPVALTLADQYHIEDDSLLFPLTTLDVRGNVVSAQYVHERLYL